MRRDRGSRAARGAGASGSRRGVTVTGWRRGVGPHTFALAALALIAIVTYAAFAHRLPLVGGGGYQFSALLHNTSQVDPGSPVRIAGIDVGTVTGVSRGPGQSARVTMSIDPDGLPIHRDATLEVRPRLFLEGNFYVDLHPGSPEAPWLSRGATLPESQTSVAVQIDQVLSTFTIPVRQAAKDLIAQLSTGLSGGGAQGLRAATRQLPAVLRQTSQLTQALRGQQPHDLSQLIGASAAVTGTLAQREAQLAGLVNGTAGVAETVAAHDGQLAAGIDQLDQLDVAAPPALQAMDGALPALRRFSSSLEPSLRIAPPVLTNTSALLDQLGLVARPGQLPHLLALLAPTVDRLPLLERRLDALLPIVTPVARCVSGHVLPVLDATVPDGKLSSGRPVWQELASSGPELGSYGSTFDGNGIYMRGLGGQGDMTVSTGRLPGEGRLFGTLSQPLEGARPVWLGPGVTPPYRPDVPCSADAPVNLNAATAPSDVTPTAAHSDSLAPLLARGARRLRGAIAGALAATKGGG